MTKTLWLQANAHKFNFTHVKSHVKDKWITQFQVKYNSTSLKNWVKM